MVMRLITFHLGAPRAYAASRRPAGTSSNMFSVVRITTGMTISASAITPAQPEKCLYRATTTAYTNRPMTIDGADSRMSLTKRVVAPSQPLGSYSAR